MKLPLACDPKRETPLIINIFGFICGVTSHYPPRATPMLATLLTASAKPFPLPEWRHFSVIEHFCLST